MCAETFAGVSLSLLALAYIGHSEYDCRQRGKQRGAYTVELVLTASNEIAVPSHVAFLVHDTFPQQIVIVQVVGRVAKLPLTGI